MKTSLIELKERNPIRIEKRFDVITNGYDNAYPTRMERIISASPTAKQCSRALAKFIIGAGFNFQFPDETFIGKNADGKLEPNDVLKEVANSIAIHNAFALHFNYNLKFKITSITPVAYKHVRYGLSDTDGYKGKIVVYDNWDYCQKKMIRKDDFKVFDIFNPNPLIIQEQIKHAGGIDKYNGQILVVKMENSVYPLSPIDPSQDDADTEYQLQLYKNRTTRKGFVGKKILTVEEFNDDDDRELFKKDLKAIQGFDSPGDILLRETKFSGDDKSKQIDIVNLDTDLKTDQFNAWETSVSNNIRRCFNSIPPVLVDFVEGKIGNTSGESFKMAQAFYNSQTSEERAVITRTFKKIFAHYYIPINPANDWTIKQLNLIADGTTTADEKTTPEDNLSNSMGGVTEAQNNLRSLVGGVTNVLDIQVKIKEGYTTYESGKKILQEFYGFTEDEAIQILGKDGTTTNQ